jgi:hypothetical protein
MQPRTLTAEDVADWLTPDQAVKILQGVFEEDYLSKKTLLGRLAGGMIQAVSGHTVIEGDKSSRRSRFLIPSADWHHIDISDDFWISGDLTYSRREYGGIGTETIRHYDLKFEPQSVRATIANAQTHAASNPEPGMLESLQKGPRVTDPHLKAWFDLYSQVYSGTAEDTEDRALQSARGMFPGKSVTRDRIRELRGAQKRGRKPREK